MAALYRFSSSPVADPVAAVRFLLDAHISGSRVGARLTAAGHEVRALDQKLALVGLDDDEVLSLPVGEGPDPGHAQHP